MVDDNADIMEGYVELLRSSGYEPITAGSGGEALQLALQSHPVLIVLDLWMPEMDFATARALKSNALTNTIPILAFSSLSFSERKAEDAGCDAFLLKTVPADQFLEVVRQLAMRGAPEPQGN